MKTFEVSMKNIALHGWKRRERVHFYVSFGYITQQSILGIDFFLLKLTRTTLQFEKCCRCPNFILLKNYTQRQDSCFFSLPKELAQFAAYHSIL